MELSGLIVPLITPYRYGVLDTESLESLSKRLIEAEVDGLFALGTTGEFQYLSLAEKEAVIRTLTKLRCDRTKILIGVSSNSLEEEIKLIRYAERAHADSVVVAPEYKNKHNSYENIMGLIKATNNHSHGKPMPIVLYNNPEITDGRDIPIDVVEELSNEERVIGIKDSSANIKYFLELQELGSNKFSVLLGSEKLFVENQGLLLDGVVFGTANLIPSLIKRLFEKKANPDDLKALKEHLTEYTKYTSPATAIKDIAHGMGLISSPEEVYRK